jgi:hypothetical protein
MRRILRAVIIATLSFTCVGAAASLGGAGTPRLGAGSAAVAACDPDGFDISHVTGGGRVTSVTVTDIADPGCTGGQLSVELTSAGAAAGGAGPVTVPADDDTLDDAVAVAIAPQPPAQQVDGFSISVVGP